MTRILLPILILFIAGCANQQLQAPVSEIIQSNTESDGMAFKIDFIKGKHHNHPTFSFWLEDLEGNYIETLFVTKYLASGIYGHGSLGDGKWDTEPGEARRPASLPYWLHKRNIMVDGETYLPTPENPVPDAISGATPVGNFVLKTKASKELPQVFRLMMEINQPWDWNEYWNNNLYPLDADYKTSCQPALIYAVTIDQNEADKAYYLNPIGHSHFSGKDGELYTDLTTLSTAKEIAHKIVVQLKK